MSTSTQSSKLLAPRPVPQSAPPPVASPIPPTPAPVSAYWGDRFLFLFWISCFVLMVLMNLFDTLAGLFGR